MTNFQEELLKLKSRNARQKFGERLQELRIQMNLTQEEVADRLDIRRDYLSKIENGVRSLKMGEMVALQEIYKADIVKLVTEVDAADRSPPATLDWWTEVVPPPPVKVKRRVRQ